MPYLKLFENGYTILKKSFLLKYSDSRLGDCFSFDNLKPGEYGGMAWIFLLFAGVLEVVWAFTMKLSNGFSDWKYSVVTLVVMAASIGLLSLSMKSLPLGTAYSVWTGIGAVGSFLVGIFVFHESTGALRMLAATLLLSGLLLMKIAS